MEQTTQSLALYLATLRAITIIHQNCHWRSSGIAAYAHHLLFERLYEASQETLDGAAEKLIGVFGDECLKLSMHNSFLGKVLSRYESLDSEDNFIVMALKIEKDFLKLSEDLYKMLETQELLTLGLDDFIMSTASRHEEAVYLLQQTANMSSEENED